MVDLGTNGDFPQRIKEMPDCEKCEPTSPYLRPAPGVIEVRNLMTGEVLRICVICLEGGVGYEELRPGKDHAFVPQLEQ